MVWNQLQKLKVVGPPGDGYLGWSVAISDGTAVVGAPFVDEAAINSGLAYVFARDGTDWIEQQTLAVSNGEDDRFGTSVAISGDTIVVGAPSDEDLAADSGSVHVFVREGTTWRHEQELTADDGATFDEFGSVLAISGPVVVAGARPRDIGRRGSAYVFAPANRPPDCSHASPTVATLWPPNHRMVEVSILGLSDPEGGAVFTTIDQIRQDEPAGGPGDGYACPDGQGIGADLAAVRAERGSPGNGRVYVVSFTASDMEGGTCTGSVEVCVPDHRDGSCVAEPATVDSTTCASGSL